MSNYFYTFKINMKGEFEYINIDIKHYDNDELHLYMEEAGFRPIEYKLVEVQELNYFDYYFYANTNGNEFNNFELMTVNVMSDIIIIKCNKGSLNPINMTKYDEMEIKKLFSNSINIEESEEETEEDNYDLNDPFIVNDFGIIEI